MARILAISSQVARGHVGLSAIVPALQAFGHDVIAFPTIVLSNHPGHAHVAGERQAPELLNRMLDAITANGWLGEIDAVLTGYLPSVAHVAFARAAVDRVRAHNPAAVHLCDPVLGDHPKGLYIDADAARAIRDRLVGSANVVKLNRFELGWLSGAEITTAHSAAHAIARCGWPLAVVSSLVERADEIHNALIVDGTVTHDIAVLRRPSVPNGTGDLLSALFLGHRLAGTNVAAAFARAIGGLRIAVEVSVGAGELKLVPNIRAIVAARSPDEDASP